MTRGRPRKQGMPRDPDGKIARRFYDAMTEREAKSVMIAARMKHHNLTAEQAGETNNGVNAGTVYGRMRISGSLTPDQWSAADWYVATRNAYQRAILSPGALSGGEGQGLNTQDSERYAEWVMERKALWREVEDCIQDVSVETRSPIAAALDVFLVRDEYLAHLEGSFKIGLNAIYRRFLQTRR